jgi:hypothetical protein
VYLTLTRTICIFFILVIYFQKKPPAGMTDVEKVYLQEASKEQQQEASTAGASSNTEPGEEGATHPNIPNTPTGSGASATAGEKTTSPTSNNVIDIDV